MASPATERIATWQTAPSGVSVGLPIVVGSGGTLAGGDPAALVSAGWSGLNTAAVSPASLVSLATDDATRLWRLLRDLVEQRAVDLDPALEEYASHDDSDAAR